MNNIFIVDSLANLAFKRTVLNSFQKGYWICIQRSESWNIVTINAILRWDIDYPLVAQHNPIQPTFSEDVLFILCFIY